MSNTEWAEQELIDLGRKLERDEQERLEAAHAEARYERDLAEREALELEADEAGAFDHLADLRDGDA